MKTSFNRVIICQLLLLLLIAGTAAAQDLEKVGTESPVKISGSVGARGVAYGAEGIEERRKPFGYTLTGNINFNFYDLQLPFSFVYGDQERGFSQPFNQFGVSPRYGWATAHLGYRSMTLSQYTLAGHQFLGAGIELNPGKFRFAFMNGRFNRAVEEDTAEIGVQEPAYERTGFAGKIGFGSDENFVDLIALKAKDDPASLKNQPAGSETLPGENLVLGAAARITPAPGLSFDVDLGVSDYTRDVRADTIEIASEINGLGGVIQPRTSTAIYSAMTVAANYSFGGGGVRASYSRVDPDYRSMGAYYMSNDLESFTIAPNFSAFGSKLNVNASFGWSHDNVQGKKNATTTRLSPSIDLNWSPSSEFGVYAQLSSLMTQQSAGNFPLNDSTRMEQQTPSFMLSPRYSTGDSTTGHSLTLTLLHTLLSDANSFTATFTEYTTTSADAAYTLSFPTRGLSLTATIGTSRLENIGGEVYTSGASLSGSKQMGETLEMSGSVGLAFQPAGTAANGTIATNWRPAEGHSIGLSVAVGNAPTGTTANNSFTEYTGTINYAYNF